MAAAIEVLMNFGLNSYFLASLTLVTLTSVTAFAEGGDKKLVIYNLSTTPHSFSQFTEETGIEVEVNRGKSIEEIRKNPINSPEPDLVIDADVIDFRDLKKQGLLRSIQSPAIEDHISSQFRDLSSGWVGMSFRGRVLAYNPEVIAPPENLRYEDLSRPEFKDKLCLRKSTYGYTRALIGSLILADGYDAVLSMVKGWVQNTTQPIFNGDLYALRALEKGTCGIAFVNSDYVLKYQAKYISKLRIVWPNQQDRGAHVNIAGLALLKESKQPELAIQFLEFLAQDEATHLSYSIIKRSFPTNLKFFDKTEAGRRYGRVKWDPTPLSKVADQDEKAQALAKEAGYLP